MTTSAVQCGRECWRKSDLPSAIDKEHTTPDQKTLMTYDVKALRPRVWPAARHELRPWAAQTLWPRWPEPLIDLVLSYLDWCPRCHDQAVAPCLRNGGWAGGPCFTHSYGGCGAPNDQIPPACHVCEELCPTCGSSPWLGSGARLDDACGRCGRAVCLFCSVGEGACRIFCYRRPAMRLCVPCATSDEELRSHRRPLKAPRLLTDAAQPTLTQLWKRQK